MQLQRSQKYMNRHVAFENTPGSWRVGYPGKYRGSSTYWCYPVSESAQEYSRQCGLSVLQIPAFMIENAVLSL